METFEKSLSNLIENQFPQVYREYGNTFILFVKKYYEYLESSNNVIYHTRRLAEYRDIDETTDDFVVYFKEQYLKNINIDTVADTRTLVKHSLDLFRSKGTERGIELLFRAAFGVGKEIYYPQDDLFKLSDGRWFKPQYLEVNNISNPDNFIGKEIIGLNSKAKAFVEKIIRKRVKNKFSDVIYISNLKNNFESGEYIRIDNNEQYDVKSLPRVIGSLTNIDIDQAGSGSNFKIGDVLEVSSNSGYSGLARVSDITVSTGRISANLVDGGYGFNNNSEILISELVLNVNGNISYSLFDTIQQDVANITFYNANGSFLNGTNLYSYHANNDLNGMGKIVAVDYSNSSSGFLSVVIYTGNLNSTTLYSQSNTIGATKNVFTSLVATANVIGSEYNSEEQVTRVGVINVNNQFYSQNPLSTSDYIVSKSNGSDFDFDIANSFLYTEYVSIDTSNLAAYANVLLSNANYLSASPAINLSSTIISAMQFENTMFGTITNFDNLDPGNNYDQHPMILVYDRKSYPFSRKDVILTYSNATLSFTNNEIVTQNATNARGLVKSSNSTHLVLKNLRILANNDFIPTQNSTTYILGQDSGANAYVDYVAFDALSNSAGINAIIDSQLTIANGAITKAEVIDSGFGFLHKEDVVLQSGNNVAAGISSVEKQGTGSGYYKQIGGFLSNNKKLHDGYYWQDYSYDVISSLTLNKYKDILKNVVHTAGFKFFGTFKHQRSANTYQATSSSEITIE